MSDTVALTDRLSGIDRARAVRYLVAALGALLVIFPLFWMVSTSLKSSSALLGFPPSLIPQSPTLEPYRKALASGQWVRWFLNTTIVSAGATVGVLAIATPAAYSLSRRDFPGARALFLVFLSTMMVPPQILLVPLFVQFSQMGLINNPLGLIAAYMILYSGFAIFLLHGFFKTLPSDIEDAARVAGIGEVKTFLRVVLPQALPGIGTAAIFVFVFAWNEFLFALTFMQRAKMYTISVGLTTFQGQHGSVVYNQMMAVSTLATIPVLVLFVLTQEKFIKGITTEF